jgi:hypothetical protein
MSDRRKIRRKRDHVGKRAHDRFQLRKFAAIRPGDFHLNHRGFFGLEWRVILRR